MMTLFSNCSSYQVEKGRERYFKWASGIVVVYSITSRSSFEKARKYLDEINQFEKETNRDITVALVGNKIDLERYRFDNNYI